MSEASLRAYNLSKKFPYVKPLYSIKYKEEDEVLAWLRDATSAIQIYYKSLFREQKANLRMFLASEYVPDFVPANIGNFAANNTLNSDASININAMYKLVMAQITMIVSNELVPSVLPNNAEYDDKIACQVTKEWLESKSYDLDLDMCRVWWEIQKKVFGENYLFPMWNPEKGDPVARETEEMSAETSGLPYIDEEGNEILDPTGKPVKLSRMPRIGDLEIANPLPWNVFIDPKPTYDKSNWGGFIDYVDVEDLKRKFPRKDFGKGEIVMTGVESDVVEGSSPNIKRVYYLWHKSMEFMPEGRFIVCTDNVMLVNKPLTDFPSLIDAQTLPIVRFLDLNLGHGVRGFPILFRNGRNLANAQNVIINQQYNNIEVESPKIFAHRASSFDARRLPAGVTVCEWEGNIKPSFEVPQSNTSSIFKFQEILKRELDEAGLQTPMVRGDTPNAQLDSFIALQHFEDQRVQLAAPDLKGHIKSMEHLYRMMMTIARDKYRKDDKRLIKIFGKHNSYKLKYFDPENLMKSYDVKITTTGNMANSKAARNQMMITIKREFPDLIQNELFIDMLGLSHSEKFTNAITAAVNAAEAENQDLLDGIEIQPPERYEDLITHWDTHRIPIQSLDFKMAPEETRSAFIAHIMATEKLMFEQAAESPAFQQRLTALKQFPMMYTPSPTNAPAQPQLEASPMTPIGAEGIEQLPSGGVPEEIGSTNQNLMEPSPIPQPQEGEIQPPISPI